MEIHDIGLESILNADWIPGSLAPSPPPFFPSACLQSCETAAGRKGAEWRLPLGKSDLLRRSTTKGTFRPAETSGQFAKILCVTKVTTW